MKTIEQHPDFIRSTQNKDCLILDDSDDQSETVLLAYQNIGLNILNIEIYHKHENSKIEVVYFQMNVTDAKKLKEMLTKFTN